MKNISRLIIVVLILNFLLSGCTSKSINNNDNVKVYDYKSFVVDKEYIEISDEDIKSIIYMDFASNDYYKLTNKKIIEDEDIVLISIESSNELYCCTDYYYEVGYDELSEDFDSELLGRNSIDSFETTIEVENETVNLRVKIEGIYSMFDISDEKNLLDFYGYDTLEEVTEFIKESAKNEIIFNYMWETIKEKSEIIEFPEYVEHEFSNQIKQLTEEASTSGQTLEAYVSSNGLNLDDIKQNVYNYYFELILAEEILAQENICIDEGLLLEYKEYLAEDNKMSLNDLEQYFSDEDIYYQTVMSELKKILISYITIQ